MSPSRRALSLVVAITLLAGLSWAPATAAADDDDLRTVGDRIATLSGQISDAARDRSRLAAGVASTQSRMEQVLAGLSQIRADLAGLEVSIAERSERLAVVREDLGVLYARLARTRGQLETARAATVAYAREAYMTAGQGLPTIAFSAKAVSDISLSVEYLHRLTADSERTVGRYEALEAQEDEERAAIATVEAQVGEEVAALQRDRGTLQGLQGVLQKRNDELQEEYERQRALLVEVDAEIAHWEGEIAALEKEQAAVRSVIADSTDSSGTAPGRLLRPVPGAISSGFGPRVHPIFGTVKMHNGVDMNAGQGEPIRAAAAGTVILSGVKGGYGNTVMIDHGGGMVTLYAHQSRLGVSVGEEVAAGETIGYVGSTGTSTAPHLHFEVRINGAPVDPVRYL